MKAPHERKNTLEKNMKQVFRYWTKGKQMERMETKEAIFILPVLPYLGHFWQHYREGKNQAEHNSCVEQETEI